jgi:hypothetical protein
LAAAAVLCQDVGVVGLATLSKLRVLDLAGNPLLNIKDVLSVMCGAPPKSALSSYIAGTRGTLCSLEAVVFGILPAGSVRCLSMRWAAAASAFC